MALLNYIDTRRALNRLTNSGLQEAIAEAVVDFVFESRRSELENLATKELLLLTQQQLKSETSDVRSEVSSLITEQRSTKEELKAEIAGVRNELRSPKEELKAKIANIRIAEIRNDINFLKLRIMGLRNELKILAAKIDNTQWVLGFVAASCTAIMVRLFLMS